MGTMKNSIPTFSDEYDDLYRPNKLHYCQPLAISNRSYSTMSSFNEHSGSSNSTHSNSTSETRRKTSSIHSNPSDTDALKNSSKSFNTGCVSSMNEYLGKQTGTSMPFNNTNIQQCQHL